MMIFAVLFYLCVSMTTTTEYNKEYQALMTIPQNIPNGTTIARLGHNKISNIATELIALSSLQELWLSYNEFTVFPDLSDVGSTLLRIDISHNTISNIPAGVFDSMSVLTSITLRYNELTYFPDLSAVGSTLASLNIGYNPITSMPTSLLQNLTVMEDLDVGHTSLTQLPSLCVQQNTLVSFNFEHNSISDASEWANSMQQCSFTQLREIELDSIQQSEIPIFGSWCANLTSLSLRGNGIMFVNSSNTMACTNLQSFELNDNLLSSLSGLLPFASSLTSVEISSNQISSTISNETLQFVNFKRVHMIANDLTQMPDFSASSTTIKSMYFDQNNIRSVDAAVLNSFTVLSILHLDDNLLTEFPNVDGPNATLVTLYLGDNLFTTFPKLNRIGGSLKKLRLDNNPGITYISVTDLEGLNALEELQLQGTSLDSVPDLHSLPNLEYLYLSQTDQTTPIRTASPYAMAALGSLTELYLENIPLDYLPSPCPQAGMSIYLGSSLGQRLCTCGMAWLKKDDLAVSGTDVNCTTFGKMWSSVTIDELLTLCDSPQPGCQTGKRL